MKVETDLEIVLSCATNTFHIQNTFKRKAIHIMEDNSVTAEFISEMLADVFTLLKDGAILGFVYV